MDFEWDHKKAVANENKHGIAFEEAAEVFADDYSSTVRDYVEQQKRSAT
jgi:uncharacterized DUF497 family protein